MIGICLKCYKIKKLTRHHVYPRRFFKNQKKPVIVMMCWDCHQGLEKQLPKYPIKKIKYLEITKEYLTLSHL